MSEVKLDIGSRSYMVNCQDGEEAHLANLAAMVDDKAGSANSAGGLNETRTLLFASLLLADELYGARNQLREVSEVAPPEPEIIEKVVEKKVPVVDEQAIGALEKLADRVEQFADGLERAVNPA